MKSPTFTPEQVAQMFKVPVANVKVQYAANAETLKKMYDKAVATGKKVSGYTADQLLNHHQQYLNLSK